MPVVKHKTLLTQDIISTHPTKKKSKTILTIVTNNKIIENTKIAICQLFIYFANELIYLNDFILFN